jgi:hypothetical protein
MAEKTVAPSAEQLADSKAVTSAGWSVVQRADLLAEQLVGRLVDWLVAK